MVSIGWAHAPLELRCGHVDAIPRGPCAANSSRAWRRRAGTSARGSSRRRRTARRAHAPPSRRARHATPAPRGAGTHRVHGTASKLLQREVHRLHARAPGSSELDLLARGVVRAARLDARTGGVLHPDAPAVDDEGVEANRDGLLDDVHVDASPVRAWFVLRTGRMRCGHREAGTAAHPAPGVAAGDGAHIRTPRGSGTSRGASRPS